MYHWTIGNRQLAADIARGREARAAAFARAGRAAAGLAARLVRRAAARIDCRRRWRASIAELRKLDDHILADIGVSRGRLMAGALAAAEPPAGCPPRAANDDRPRLAA